MSDLMRQFDQAYIGEVKELIPGIDRNLFSLNDGFTLLYLFPLLEHMIIQIFSLTQLVDVEIKTQGQFRTVSSLIHELHEKEYIDEDFYNYLNQFYGDNGLRNQMTHFDSNNNQFQVGIQDLNVLKQIILRLFIVYNEVVNKDDYKDMPFIEKIE